jgi:hypothetical protein
MHGCGPSARQVIVEQRWSKDVFVYTAHGINTLVREIRAASTRRHSIGRFWIANQMRS